MYNHNNEEEKNMLHHFIMHTQIHDRFAHPYIATASASVTEIFC